MWPDGAWRETCEEYWKAGCSLRIGRSRGTQDGKVSDGFQRKFQMNFHEIANYCQMDFQPGKYWLLSHNTSASHCLQCAWHMRTFCPTKPARPTLFRCGYFCFLLCEIPVAGVDISLIHLFVLQQFHTFKIRCCLL